MTKKLLKILFTLLLILSFCITYVSASDINMNLPGTDNNQTENSQNVDNPEENNQNDVDNSQQVDEPSPTDVETLQPSTVNSSPDSGLSAASIINILLITVGVILILLAIAIIIRLK